MKILVPLVLTACLTVMAGCTTVDNALLTQAQDYHETIVKGVLLPAYEANPEVSPEAKANVRSAVAEHGSFLDDIASGGAE